MLFWSSFYAIGDCFGDISLLSRLYPPLFLNRYIFATKNSEPFLIRYWYRLHYCLPLWPYREIFLLPCRSTDNVPLVLNFVFFLFSYQLSLANAKSLGRLPRGAVLVAGISYQTFFVFVDGLLQIQLLIYL